MVLHLNEYKFIKLVGMKCEVYIFFYLQIKNGKALTQQAIAGEEKHLVMSHKNN